MTRTVCPKEKHLTEKLSDGSAHSPELNPVEHLWEELREEKACPNQAFKSLHEVEHALCQEIDRLQNDPA